MNILDLTGWTVRQYIQYLELPGIVDTAAIIAITLRLLLL